MSISLEKSVSKFLDCRWDGYRPLLLAYSGGPDSLALLHLLNDYRKTHSLVLALAHVDHGWREESREEACQIALIAAQLGLQLHTIRLEPEGMTGNLEAACREARLKFFAGLCSTYHYQAVLLAHHADDLAETVLKRLLEGCTLSNLHGLRSEVGVLGMTLWRPLLNITKASLGRWLKDRQLIGFDDRTNRDPRFLRARFRTKIIPQLSQEFGKEVSSALMQIGADSAELRGYLDHKLAPYLSRICRSRLGLFLDLSQECPDAMLEIKHLIRRCCEDDDFSVGRECIDTTANLLHRGAADKQVVMGKKRLYIDRRRLFVLSRELPAIPADVMKLQEGSCDYGSWRVHVSRSEMVSEYSCSGWQSLWQAGGEVALPPGEYHLGGFGFECSLSSHLSGWEMVDKSQNPRFSQTPCAGSLLPRCDGTRVSFR